MTKRTNIKHGTHCKHCDRPMRHRNTPYTSAPNTIIHSSNGECVSCAKAIRAGRDPLAGRNPESLTLGTQATPTKPKARKPRPRPIKPGTPCKYCKRPMRHKRLPYAQAPKTVAHAGDGACQTCKIALREGRDPLKGRMVPKERKNCSDCGKPMRPAGTKLAAFPDTVCHAARGLCSGCNDRARRRAAGIKPKDRKNTVKTGDPCRGCGQPLRPKGVSAQDAPGTMVARRAGFCEPCVLDGSKLDHAPGDQAVRTALKSTPTQLELFRKRHALPPRPEGLTPEEMKVRLAIEDLIRERRRRGVPPEGILPADEQEEAA